MKKVTLILFILFVSIGTNQTYAQTVDEIISNYLENTGGAENWKKLNGTKTNAKVNQGGMEIPLEIIQLKDGRQLTEITFQGKKLKQGVFDGKTLWSTNFMTQKAEKSDAEATENFKSEIGNFPTPFLDYKQKGYTVELLGKEEIDGTEAFKIKLVKKPVKVDGVETENVSYYFFDSDNYVPIVVQSEIKSGPMKGKVSEIKLSDYQEVEGLYFPFSVSQGLKGKGGQGINFESIELNPKVEATAFEFPKKKTETKK